jgi:hypothetical protein
MFDERDIVRLAEQESQPDDFADEPDHLGEAVALLKDVSDFLESGLKRSNLSERAQRKLSKLQSNVDDFLYQFE